MSCGGCSAGVGGGCGIGGGCGVAGGCGDDTPDPGTVAVVGVRFPSTARTYHFDSAGYTLELGEHCIVTTDRGPSYAIVTLPSTPSPRYTQSGVTLRKVLRRATFEDREKFDQADQQERAAFEHCRKRITERRLEMKLVNVHFALDAPKATFFFTAEGRVDFRGLVRDLASSFKVRVEMRQIGVRDAAKLLGGYGDCGRPLCCSTWLKHFEPITIQMAKAQNLSLNPARISGMCGRLKCCLRYEYVPRERTPRKGKGKAKGRRGGGPRDGNGDGARDGDAGGAREAGGGSPHSSSESSSR